jgi:acetylglutamate kinase
MSSLADCSAEAEILSKALPYLQKHKGKTFVVKYGGNALGGGSSLPLFARDIALLKQVGINPVVVHGGGPQINAMLDRLQIKSAFVNGLRVTDAPTMEVVEMVLSGGVNRQIVQAINLAAGKMGGHAIGLSGRDARLITARKLSGRDVDLGFVGEAAEIDTNILRVAERSGLIPVVAPLGADEHGNAYNINADTAAGAIAGALKAERFMLLTDVPGVLDKTKTLIPTLTVTEARRLLADGTATGGMIPKLETCISAVEAGVDGAVIMDGRTPHALLLELFTEGGAGTLITAG